MRGQSFVRCVPGSETRINQNNAKRFEYTDNTGFQWTELNYVIVLQRNYEDSVSWALVCAHIPFLFKYYSQKEDITGTSTESDIRLFILHTTEGWHTAVSLAA